MPQFTNTHARSIGNTLRRPLGEPMPDFDYRSAPDYVPAVDDLPADLTCMTCSKNLGLTKGQARKSQSVRCPHCGGEHEYIRVVRN